MYLKPRDCSCIRCFIEVPRDPILRRRTLLRKITFVAGRGGYCQT